MSGGLVKRAAKETGVPEQTVRNWKRRWDVEGLPESIGKELDTKVLPDFVTQALRVRDLALTKIEEVIPEATIKNLPALGTIVGILEDKVRMAQGLATSRTEVTHSLPSPEEMRTLAQSYAQGAVSAALERDEAIIDAEEIVEQAPRALLSPLHD